MQLHKIAANFFVFIFINAVSHAQAKSNNKNISANVEAFRKKFCRTNGCVPVKIIPLTFSKHTSSSFNDSTYTLQYADTSFKYNVLDSSFEYRLYKLNNEWLYYTQNYYPNKSSNISMAKLRIGSKNLPANTFKALNQYGEGLNSLNPDFNCYYLITRPKKYILLTSDVYGGTGISSQFTVVCLISMDKKFSKRYSGGFSHFSLEDFICLESKQKLNVIDKNNYPWKLREIR